MTEKQNRRAAQDVIYLAGCAVKEEIPDLTRIENTEAVYTYAAKHRLTAAVAMALESAGQKDRRSAIAIMNALKRKILFEKAYAQVKEELEKAGIWYMPLKGILLKDYYPKPGMREMADHDILFDADRAEDVKSIMEGLDFQPKKCDSRHHDVYYKPPVRNFEMHRALFEPGLYPKLYEYYQDVEKRLLGDGYEKHLSPEDFYLYLIAHEYKHYMDHGTGLRSLLDTYVYLQKEALDAAYVTREAEKLGIAEFEAVNRSLAQRLFSGEALTESEKETLQFILDAGVYGSRDLAVRRRLSGFGYGKLRYAFERFIEPLNKNSWNYRNLSCEFPIFYKHKILLPLLPFYRVFLRLFSGRLKAELEALKKAEK